MKVWLTFLDEHHRWPVWIPVFIGGGVWFYFSLPQEPSPLWAWVSIVPFGGLLLKGRIRLFIWVLFFTSLGFSAGIIRTSRLSVHMLEEEIGPLWLGGEIQSVEEKLSSTGKLSNRVVLSQLSSRESKYLPQQVRLTLRGELPAMLPGQWLRVRAKLLPLSGPTHPGGFNFRQHAYFKGIEATGYNMGKPRVIKSLPSQSFQMKLERFRQSVTQVLRKGLPEPQGGIAAALTTGDRSGIPDDVRETFVASGLAHILAISGLHLSIVAGLIFFMIRKGAALIPPLALRVNTKKIAAMGAIIVTGLYLGLSGFGVPAQRAFLMTSLIMVAILINRNAFSLRTVAFAATVILLVTPENLFGPSFQLSFSAVVGLIAAYEAWQNPIERWLGQGGFMRKLCVYFGGVAFTSLIATLATMPFTIMTFNQFTLMSIFANMLAVPLTAFFIMPSALLTIVSMLLGLEEFTLPLLGYAIELLQHIAQYASAVPGSQVLVPAPSPPSFYLIVLGGLWFCLWSQSWRYFGAVLMLMGIVLLVLTPRPHILIDGQGKLVAICGDDGQIYVTSKRKGKFQREMWLRSLGESTVSLMPCEGDFCEMTVQGKVIQVMIAPQIHHPTPGLLINLSDHSCSHTKNCISKADLTRDGAHAVYIDGSGAIDIRTNSTHNRF